MYVVRYDTCRPCQCQISRVGIIWVEGSILSVWRNPMPMLMNFVHEPFLQIGFELSYFVLSIS